MDQMDQLRAALAAALPGLELRTQEPMARHTTFRVGGPAALMALPRREEELPVILRLAGEAGIPPFFLGKGSNLLVADEGVNAFVVKLAGGLTRLEQSGPGEIYAGAGITMAQAALFALEQGLTGLEFAHGIPGTVGGGLFMNAGAYDGEMAQVAAWVDCLDDKGERRRLEADTLELGYRHSVFARLPWLILGVAFRLEPGDPEAIRAAMGELSRRRREKQPLEFPSAGSTFKRPPGHFAGALIQQCGLKGERLGGAQVSEKHAGFVVNAGGATCGDILGLIRLVRETVFEKTGVLLEPEVRLLGCALEDVEERNETP